MRAVLETRSAPEGLIDDAILLVSELVSNAVRHSGGAVTLSMLAGPSAWEMRVHDDAAELPVMRVGDPGAEGGRGLAIIDAIATDWGTVRNPTDGKDVWVTLSGC